MQYVGFVQDNNGGVIEYLPQSEQMRSTKQNRLLFFNLFNFYVDKTLRFKKSEYIGYQDLKAVFTTKIDHILKQAHQNRPKDSFTLDLAGTKIIHAYLEKKSTLVLQSPTSNVAKLIQMIYKNGTYELMMDLDDMFLNLVYERIKKVNKKCKVELGINEIIIYDPDPLASPTVVIPSYKNIEKKTMRQDQTVNHNIDMAMDHLRSDKIRQVFLIFPKNNSFAKHVDLKFQNDIKLSEDEYRVKMIPYSFSFCIKNQKRRTKKWQ
ncbi:MAG: hypothetical protein K0U47_12480 [Epsilonproteobacteria bacterium]|nr:hypothetical protein [Campylobacterota bacterium]